MTPSETDALLLIAAGVATGLTAVGLHFARKHDEREQALRELRHEALSQIVNEQLTRWKRINR